MVVKGILSPFGYFATLGQKTALEVHRLQPTAERLKGPLMPFELGLAVCVPVVDRIGHERSWLTSAWYTGINGRECFDAK